MTTNHGSSKSQAAASPSTPTSPTGTAHWGYVVPDSSSKVYLETHTVDVRRQGERVRGADIAVLPVQGVWLFGVPFVMSPERALEVTKAIVPKTVVPTGNDLEKAHGLMSSAMLWTRGAIDDFAKLLQAAQVQTTLSNPKPGESVTTNV